MSTSKKSTRTAARGENGHRLQLTCTSIPTCGGPLGAALLARPTATRQHVPGLDRAAIALLPALPSRRAVALATFGGVRRTRSGLELCHVRARGGCLLPTGGAIVGLGRPVGGVAGARPALPHVCALQGKAGAGMHHRRASGVDGGDDLF
jgi:hypothetical protein